MNYAKYGYYQYRHHIRYRNFVNSLTNKLTCQECRGGGGEVEPVLDDGSGPFIPCGFCEGTGLITPYLRGLWLKWKRQAKALK